MAEIRWGLTAEEAARTKGYPDHLIWNPDKVAASFEMLTAKLTVSIDGGDPVPLVDHIRQAAFECEISPRNGANVQAAVLRAMIGGEK